MKRRDFLLAVSAGSSALALPANAAIARKTAAVDSPVGRADWAAWLHRIASPVLSNLARGTLRRNMPFERGPGYDLHPDATYVEAVGRTLAGVAPWLSLPDDASGEARVRHQLRDDALQGLTHAVDPHSPDRLNFHAGQQPIVDAAYLAHAFLRAPKALWDPLDAKTKRGVIAAFQSLRDRKASYSNWLLFAAMTETFLRSVDAAWDPARVDFALRKFDDWYVGDGWYSDGPRFAFDYYNSYVIHPMLVDLLRVHSAYSGSWDGGKDMIADRYERARKRMRRFGSQQERMIGPDGSYPLIGRSITYRTAAFQALAQLALQDDLPEGVSPAQVRCALGAVHRRMYASPGVFDANGWLQLGFANHQPDLANSYTSTGSLYMATLSFLPLGLPPTHAFWTAPAADWTQKKAWAGLPVPQDYHVGY